MGPDRILPANSLSTTWPDGAVEIRFSDHDDDDDDDDNDDDQVQ